MSPNSVPARQCGRCRAFFAGDDTLNPGTLQDWWLCDSCRTTLLGASPGQPAAARDRASTGTPRAS